MRLRILVCACLAALVAPPACNAQAVGEMHVWYLTEVADVIAVGKLHVTSNPAATTDKFAESLAVTLDVQQTLKGSANASRETLHYQMFQGYEKPLEKKLSSLNGKTVVVFLANVPDQGYYIDLYFGENRVIAANQEAIANIKSVMMQEDVAVKEISKYETNTAHDAEVKDAIEDLASADASTKDKGRDRLMTLGCVAVPSIIKQMRDYRVYHGVLSLPDRAENGFEPVQQFNPKTVYAALSSILQYITGTYFRHSEFVDTEAQRDADYHGWLVYLAYESNAFGSVEDSCKK